MPKERLSREDLTAIVRQYAGEFEGWALTDDLAIYRDEFPIRQMMWFEPLSVSEYYRPTTGIHALPLPMARMLDDCLHYATRQIDHADRWRENISAMEHRFRPDIRQPIDLGDVTRLCEAEAQDSANDFVMLAILYAWLGEQEEAKRCCIRMQSSPPPRIAPLIEWELEMKAFGVQLAKAIESGRERQFLTSAAQMASADPYGIHWS
jgi:hypothetical protein